MLFHRGKKSAEIGKQYCEIKRISELGCKCRARFHPTRRCYGCSKCFLKRGDVFVEIKKFCSKWMLRGEPLGAPHARVVLGPTGLCAGHLRGGEDSPTISLYHPGW